MDTAEAIDPNPVPAWLADMRHVYNGRPATTAAQVAHQRLLQADPAKFTERMLRMEGEWLRMEAATGGMVASTPKEGVERLIDELLGKLP